MIEIVVFDKIGNVFYPGKVDHILSIRSSFLYNSTTPTQTHHIQPGNTCFRGDIYLVEQGVRVSAARVE